MNADRDRVYLSTLRVDADVLLADERSLTADAGQARILRTVLMKPEAEDAADAVFGRLEELAGLLQLQSTGRLRGRAPDPRRRDTR